MEIELTDNSFQTLHKFRDAVARALERCGTKVNRPSKIGQ